jgi:flagellar basal-body rod protein FlgG
MSRSLYTAATGLSAQQFNLDVLANNLANVSTAGFKASRANFQDLIYQAQNLPGAATGTNSSLPTGSQVGLGVSAGYTTTINTQGTLQNTGNNTDLAISGDGYFKILMPDGSNAYTRAGNFSVDATGKLVTPQGYAVVPEIVIPPNKQSVNISADGQVSVTLPGQQNPQVVGQLQVTTFPNPAGMQAMGGNLFKPTAAAGQPTDSNPGSQGAGSLQSGTVEGSNVDVVDQLVQMIIIQRAYDTNSKVIQSADEMMTTANNIKR